MSAKAIAEACGKDLLNRYVQGTAQIQARFASVTETTNLKDLANQHPWLKTEVSKTFILFPESFLISYFPSQKLVVKPDQLIKRRGKLGLVKVNTDLKGVEEFVQKHMNKDITVLDIDKANQNNDSCVLDWQICGQVAQFHH